jgi:hypothetical protein
VGRSDRRDSGSGILSADLRKRDGSINIQKAGRHYTTFYLNEFFEAEREAILTLDARGNPLKLFVLYEDFIRRKVLEANPALRKESFDGREELVYEARVGALVRRILPEFSQFIAAWLDRFESPPLQTPTSDVRRGIVRGQPLNTVRPIP